MKLSVVLGTYNRLDQVQRCIESIVRETRTPTKIYITDAGSTDGTVEYLQSIASETIIPVLVGKKLGQAKAYNDVFDIVDTKYVCWLSDDNEVVDGGLDCAVEILEGNPAIGMVALKTTDVQGPFVDAPYIGGISSIGILNVNQGVLPTKVMKQVGGFSEEFRDYGIDSALTAEDLHSNYDVVYTKQIALHHYRNWSEDPRSENYQWLQARQIAMRERYEKTYGADGGQEQGAYRLKKELAKRLKTSLTTSRVGRSLRNSAFARTTINVLSGRYISLLDPILTLGRKYHLVQSRGKN